MHVAHEPARLVGADGEKRPVDGPGARPDLGEGIAEVELVVWHVAVGDAIVEDQGLADVMTDKASVEIPSPVAGTVLALGGEVGQVYELRRTRRLQRETFES